MRDTVKSEFQHAFTVFTPTFNRAHTLGRVYGSLAAQTFRDFEWLVVDDGSTDGTAELIRGWAAAASFPIRYQSQPNSGKHVAFNRATRAASGRLFTVADSDDAFLPATLERFAFHWHSIPQEQRNSFAGVTCLCQDESGRLIGKRYPFDPTDSNLLEVYYRYGVRQEQWSVYRTDVLREFPYPEVPGEKFVLEGLVWSQIARKYKARFVNEPLRIYYQGEPDQLSRRKPKADTLAAMFFAHMLNDDIDWLRYSPYEFWRAAAFYGYHSLLTRKPLPAQWAQLTNWKAKLLFTLALPAAYALAAREPAQPAAAVARRSAAK